MAEHVDLTMRMKAALGELQFQLVAQAAELDMLRQRLAELEPETPVVDEKTNGHAKVMAVG